MAKKNTGTITDPSAPPFATKSGRPADPGPASKGFDYLRTGGGGSDAQRAERMPGRSFVANATSQQAPPPVDDPMASPRPQTPATARDRVDPDTIPSTGTTPPAVPGAARAAAGIVDPGPRPSRSPMKNLR